MTASLVVSVIGLSVGRQLVNLLPVSGQTDKFIFECCIKSNI